MKRIFLIVISAVACAVLWQLFGPLKSSGFAAPADTGRALYMAQQNGEYAYERSAPEAGQDDESMTVLWVRLTGMQGGVITVQGTRDSSGMVLTYRSGCQFINVHDYRDGKLVSKGTIRVSNDPVLSQIMQDAVAGYLNVSPATLQLSGIPDREIKCDTR